MKRYYKALIIDDDTDLCIMLQAVVRSSVSNVQCAFTLSAGRHLVENWKPDIVFIDNNLPDGQGLELAKEIKAMTPSVLIILISAIDTPKSEALKFAADVFLEKPFTYSAVLKALETGTKELSKEG